jgi:hypothetical protein
MAITVVEQRDTRNLSQSTGRVSASRTFVVYDDASPLLTPADVRGYFNGTDLPQIGDVFPKETDVYAVSFDISLIEDSEKAWRVQFSYENVEPGDSQPNEEGYTEITIDYKAEFRDVYRLGPNVPTNGNPNANDIGGTQVDAAGSPISRLQRMSELLITEVVAGSTFPDRSLKIRAARGKRNTSVFQGAPIGQVLYQGATATRIAVNKFQIQHRFAQDEFYHLVQVPAKNQEGEVVKAVVNNLWRAKDVYFVQPFPDGYDFNLLSENF